MFYRPKEEPVSLELQAWLGHEAEMMYSKFLRNPQQLTTYEAGVMAVFAGMQQGATDMDERIAALKKTWDKEPFMDKFTDRWKLLMVLDTLGPQLRGVAGGRPVRLNFNRLRTLTRFGMGNYEVAKAWVYPPEAPVVEEPAV